MHKSYIIFRTVHRKVIFSKFVYYTCLCLSIAVCLYPLNVLMARLLGQNLCGTPMTQRKFNELQKLVSKSFWFLFNLVNLVIIYILLVCLSVWLYTITLQKLDYRAQIVCRNSHYPRQGYNARKVNCSCVYSAYILKPVHSGRNL